jgi:urease accessory protein
MQAATLIQPSHQRSRGRLELDYHRHEGRTVLGGLYQSPPMRALFPDPEADEAPICALVNTAGGLAGGDRVDIALSLGPGARASFSTPAAEKIYRSLGPATEISVNLQAGPGAVFEWIPQETILFEGARLDRRLSADIAEDASLLLAEALVFGRAARGETWRRGALQDFWRITRGGKLLWADGLSLGDDIAADFADPFGLANAEALGSLVLAGPLAAPDLRDALREDGALASLVRPGLLVTRWLGGAVEVREGLGAAICRLRPALGLPARLPRLWTT